MLSAFIGLRSKDARRSAYRGGSPTAAGETGGAQKR
jgi:hypothetical protein